MAAKPRVVAIPGVVATPGVVVTPGVLTLGVIVIRGVMVTRRVVVARGVVVTPGASAEASFAAADAKKTTTLIDTNRFIERLQLGFALTDASRRTFAGNSYTPGRTTRIGVYPEPRSDVFRGLTPFARSIGQLS